jgi:hypothetical protein
VSKFRIKMKLQGLELEIEGAREDAAVISQNIGAQLSSMMQPVSGIIEGEISHDGAVPVQAPQIINGAVKKQRRTRKQSSVIGSDSQESTVIDFKSSPEKFGNPQQQWKTADKALWLIYVLQENSKGTEFSTKAIVDTFNKHFKQSGRITTSNVTRDLGRLKTNTTPTVIGENSSNSPSTWYLTEAGIKKAQGLVAEALGVAG